MMHAPQPVRAEERLGGKEQEEADDMSPIASPPCTPPLDPSEGLLEKEHTRASASPPRPAPPTPPRTSATLDIAPPDFPRRGVGNAAEAPRRCHARLPTRAYAALAPPSAARTCIFSRLRGANVAAAQQCGSSSSSLMQGPWVELAAGLGSVLWALGIWSDHDLPCACAVIFVDWDDTILSSTVLTRTAGLRVDEASPLDPRLVEELRALEMDALRFIEECQTHGTMVIVTNAETGWVQLSGKRFLPRVLDALMKYHVGALRVRAQVPQLAHRVEAGGFHGVRTRQS